MTRLNTMVIILIALLGAMNLITYANAADKMAISAEKETIGVTTIKGYTLGVENFDAADAKAIEAAGLASTFQSVAGLTGKYTVGEIKDKEEEGGFGDTGKYLFTDGGTTTLLTADKDLHYFGMWISNLLDGLTVTFLKGDTKVQEFTSLQITKLLVEAHMTNPKAATKGKTANYYAFVNFACTAADCAFNKVQIAAAASKPVYTDNHTVGYKTAIELTVEAAGKKETTIKDLTLGVELFDKATKGDVPKDGFQATFGGAVKDLNGKYEMGKFVESSDTAGGAGKTGNFLEILGTGDKATTLTAARELTYFGMWVSKLEVADELSLKFMKGTDEVQSFSSAQIMKLLTADYAKNPEKADDTDKDKFYGFLNFACTGTHSFNKVVISSANAKTVSTDNHTIGYKAVKKATTKKAVPRRDKSNAMRPVATAILAAVIIISSFIQY